MDDFKIDSNHLAESVAGLQNFLKNFSGRIEELNEELREKTGNRDEIPSFRIPDWPAGLPEIEVKFRLKKFWVPKIVENMPLDINNVLRLVKKRVGLTSFTINQKGEVEITIQYHPYRAFCSLEPHRLYHCDLERKYNIFRSYQKDTSNHNRLRCFIVFSQFLEEICADIVRQLEHRLIQLQKNVQEYEKITVAVQKAFEPLVPFVVADILEGEK